MLISARQASGFVASCDDCSSVYEKMCLEKRSSISMTQRNYSRINCYSLGISVRHTMYLLYNVPGTNEIPVVSCTAQLASCARNNQST